MKLNKKAYATAAAFVLVAFGAWFLFLSPKSSDITVNVASPTLASNQQQTATGSVTPAVAGRVVVLEQKADGTWKELDRVATEATGEYKFEIPMTENGESQIRARVLDAGRRSEAASKAVTIKVLDPTQLEAQVAKFARADRPLRVPGRVTPAAVRDVVVETSPDGQTWTQAATATTARADGKFVAQLADLAPGPVQVRVRVEESETAAPAVGEANRVSVEDYKAAGAAYLEIVKPVNDLYDQYRKLPDYGAFTLYQGLDATLSKALTHQARAFRQNSYWPQEVKSNIVLLARSNILEADMYNLAAKAESQSEYNAIDAPDYPKGSSNAPVIIRAALGLPKRQ